MAYTRPQLDALIALRASGLLRTQVGDRVLQYQSGADLDRAINQAKRDLAAAEATSTGSTLYQRHFMEYSRG